MYTEVEFDRIIFDNQVEFDFENENIPAELCNEVIDLINTTNPQKESKISGKRKPNRSMILTGYCSLNTNNNIELIKKANHITIHCTLTNTKREVSYFTVQYGVKIEDFKHLNDYLFSFRLWIIGDICYKITRS